MDKKKAEMALKEKLKMERIKYIQESLTIVETCQNVKQKEQKQEESCELLKEGAFNNKILLGIEQRKKLRARFHQKIRGMSISEVGD